MKEINQLIHLTSSFENLISILEKGFFSSYASEEFCGEKILIPMISFSNVLFRDIGEKEVVNYGKYGIGIEREFGIELKLNPVNYLYENSVLEKTIKKSFDLSILPQTLDVVKDLYSQIECENITDYINFNPLPIKIKKLINDINKNTDEKLIDSIKDLFGEFFEASLHQILLAKPYKIEKKDGSTFFAYNEREWRKSFFDLTYIRELKPNGKINEHYLEIINTEKPHLKDSKYNLKIPINKIKYIIVTNYKEIDKVNELIKKTIGFIPDELLVNTIESLKGIEEK